MSEWFSFSTLSNLASQASKLADDLADSLAAQAAAVQTEFETEHMKVKQEKEAQDKMSVDPTSLLPWETSDESKMILSQDLMEKILELSLCDKNFTVTPPNIHAIEFNFNAVVPVIMRLLKIDANLARMHSKLSLKMNEEVFWHNYFFRVHYLRAVVGMDDPTPFQLDIYPVVDIIHHSVLPAVTVGISSSSTASGSQSATTSPKSASTPSSASSTNTSLAPSKVPSPELSAAAQKQLQQQQERDKLQHEKEKQQQEKERQMELRRQAEAKLAAAVEAELSDSNGDDMMQLHQSSISPNDISGAADLDLDLDLDLGDLGDLDDLGDLGDLGDLDLDEDAGIGGPAEEIDVSSYEDLAGTSVGGSG